MHSLFTHTHSLRELLISWRGELLAQELEEVEWQAGHGRDQKRLPGEHPRQDESLICNAKWIWLQNGHSDIVGK